MRLLAVSLLFVSSIASAQAIPRAYIGTSGRAFSGAGLEGHNVFALGQDVFTGYRITRWFSLEGFYAYQVQLGYAPPAGAGVFCQTSPARTWIGDSYRWQTLGVRPWLHFVHLTALDVSVAPVISVGFLLDHTSECGGNNIVTKEGVFEGGLDLAAELRPTRWFGVRVAVDTSINVGIAVLEASGWVGPVLRF